MRRRPQNGPLGNIKAVVSGTSTAVEGFTLPTISDPANNRMVQDHEGNWHYVPQEALRVQGARPVENLLSFSEDFSQSAWTKQAGSSVELVADSSAPNDSGYVSRITWAAPATTASVFQQKTLSVGGNAVSRIAVKGVAGESIGIWVDYGSGGEDVRVDLTLDGNWQDISTSRELAGSGLTTFAVRHVGGLHTAEVVDIAFAQLEESTGRADTTTPSEYVSTGVGTGAELLDTADFTDGSSGGGVVSVLGTTVTAVANGGAPRYYNNGVSTVIGATYVIEATNVVSGGNLNLRVGTTLGGNDVVSFATFASGTTKKIVFIAQSTTSYYNSSSTVDFTLDNISIKRIDHGANADGFKYFFTENGNVVSSNVVTEGTGAALTAVKGYFAEGAATEISGYSADIDNWAGGTATVAQDAVGLRGLPNTAFTITDASATTKLSKLLDTTIADDNAVHYGICRFAYDAAPSSYPAFYIACITGTTQVYAGGVFDPSDGSYVDSVSSNGGTIEAVWRDGDFWNVLLKAPNNGTGNTSLRSAIEPAYNEDGSSTSDGAAQGSVVVASFEAFTTTWSYSPILTTGGTPKTRVTDREGTIPPAYASATHSGQLDVTFYMPPATLSSAQMLVDFGSGKGIRLGTTSGTIEIYDGTNTETITVNWSVYDTVRIKYYLDDTNSLMNISVDGTKGTAETYATITPTEITLASVTQGVAIKDYLFFNTVNGDAWLSV